LIAKGLLVLGRDDFCGSMLLSGTRMVYDTKTVLARYKHTQDLPEGEADESACPLVGGSLRLKTLGCEPGGCQTCCLGVVEIVRRYNERCADVEAKAESDTTTRSTSE